MNFLKYPSIYEQNWYLGKEGKYKSTIVELNLPGVNKEKNTTFQEVMVQGEVTEEYPLASSTLMNIRDKNKTHWKLRLPLQITNEVTEANSSTDNSRIKTKHKLGSKKI